MRNRSDIPEGQSGSAPPPIDRIGRASGQWALSVRPGRNRPEMFSRSDLGVGGLADNAAGRGTISLPCPALPRRRRPSCARSARSAHRSRQQHHQPPEILVERDRRCDDGTNLVVAEDLVVAGRGGEHLRRVELQPEPDDGRKSAGSTRRCIAKGRLEVAGPAARGVRSWIRASTATQDMEAISVLSPANRTGFSVIFCALANRRTVDVHYSARHI